MAFQLYIYRLSQAYDTDYIATQALLFLLMPCFPFTTMPNTKYLRDKTFMVTSGRGHLWKKSRSSHLRITCISCITLKIVCRKHIHRKRNKLQNRVSFVLQTFCTISMRDLIIRFPISYKYFKI